LNELKQRLIGGRNKPTHRWWANHPSPLSASMPSSPTTESSVHCLCVPDDSQLDEASHHAVDGAPWLVSLPCSHCQSGCRRACCL